MALDVYIRSDELDERCCFLETEDLLAAMRGELELLTKETGQRIDLYGDATFAGSGLERLEHYLRIFSERLEGRLGKSPLVRAQTRKDLESLLVCVTWARRSASTLVFVGD